MGLQEIVSKAANMAFTAIGDLSQNLTLKREQKGQYDPISGKFTGTINKSYSCKGVILNYSKQETGIFAMSGTSISVNDKKCIINANSLEVIPQLTDTILTSDNKKYSIVSIKDTKPNITTFLYELHIKVS